ncbi:hypothetical protein GGI13_000746 [Coemansia sp. RSA 455]|nr:hypothetical protein LPJ71_002695 [Coemansia sp. S17]KAJ2017938.1 hypothetical protein GGI14_002646 [Coemansia sp. S680]KAJ2098622.1 hypothetical protein GGI09_003217 [Coemansia sp. S100]KAJ2107901.1 hypothetical protein GGI16_001348 [Coemansia sp. S142-1]KAJ2257957.1 hypothetical protein GGI13_000746 [Coemansia sp. RSA 455]
MLSEGLPDEESSSDSAGNNGGAIAALSCGHVFHLTCITSWDKRNTDTTCPYCNARHLGLVLVLHIEYHKDHVLNRDCDDTETNESDQHEKVKEAISQLPYKALLNSVKMHASNWQALQKENTLLKLAIDAKDNRLHEKQGIISDLYKELTALEHKVEELELISKGRDVESSDSYYSHGDSYCLPGDDYYSMDDDYTWNDSW